MFEIDNFYNQAAADYIILSNNMVMYAFNNTRIVLKHKDSLYVIDALENHVYHCVKIKSILAQTEIENKSKPCADNNVLTELEYKKYYKNGNLR